MNRIIVRLLVLFSVFLSARAFRQDDSTSQTGTGISSSVSLRADRLGGEGFGSSFRTINRRRLLDCGNLNPYVKITLDTTGPLSDEQTVNVTITGLVDPSEHDWIAVVSPSNASTSNCPQNELLYVATGDLAELPLLCHYPVKFKYLKEDPSYLSCQSSVCQVKGLFGTCLVKSCAATVSFRLINIRTDIQFVLFRGGLQVPCVAEQAGPLSFANPKAPLYGHISSVDSSGTSMQLTWVSGDSAPQTVQYANAKTATSTVRTFTKENMCKPGAAADFGFHNPGYIHTALMDGLSPSTEYAYQYGSQTVGFSPNTSFSTPPAAGDDQVTIIIYGDMGKAERDGSLIHYIQPGSISVIDAITDVVSRENVDFVFHIGDISYATGFLVEWDNFLELIEPFASRVSYMTAIGNHERDHPLSGSYYEGTDSGGECGIPYYNYFPMPSQGQDKPWYSLESGPIHFTIASSEHDWTEGSEQYKWLQTDLASVNRTRTPWVIYAGHRPMYSSVSSPVEAIIRSVDVDYRNAVEPLLWAAKVDLVLAGHVHNYERLCAVYQAGCLLNATRDASGMDTYDFTNYKAPVQAVIGMSGFELDAFEEEIPVYSRVRISEYGYVGIQATNQRLLVEYMYVNGSVGDAFAIVK
ncbi:hypothetical protein R1sor_019625 [Riccia sorocarpa]|uniref:Purple acid phosphatase n=1 Tax=Riccia sorocarpa TaxID=122646 RepID=A0ABD3ID16_9MARC